MNNVVHTGYLDGQPIRFFASPLQGSDFPWPCADDLLAALDLPEDFNTDFRRALACQKGEGFDPADRATITADGSIVTIFAHYCATGVVDTFRPDLAPKLAVIQSAAGQRWLRDMPPEQKLNAILSAATRRK